MEFQLETKFFVLIYFVQTKHVTREWLMTFVGISGWNLGQFLFHKKEFQVKAKIYYSASNTNSHLIGNQAQDQHGRSNPNWYWVIVITKHSSFHY